MNQIPNCNPQELQKLDERILSSNQKGNKLEKAKKDIFKRLTSQVSVTVALVILSDVLMSYFSESLQQKNYSGST
jgi:hypothetical protein